MSLLTTSDLVAIAQRHDGVKTLSAYVAVPRDAIDPVGHARISLRNGIASAREVLGASSTHDERGEFDACAERLLMAVESGEPRLGGCTWVGFAVTGGDMYTVVVPAELPAQIPEFVVWDAGLRVAPYFVLDPPATAILALIDHERAAFFSLGVSEGLQEITRFRTKAKVEVGAHTSAPPRVAFHPGTHGTPAADSAARQASSAYGRHRARIVDQIVALADSKRILLGGVSDAVMHVASALPAAIRPHTTIAPSLHFTSTVPEMRDAVAAIERAENAEAERLVVDDVLSRARASRRGVLGEGPVHVALAQRAVDTLAMSARMIAEDPAACERIIREAVLQHAEIHVVHNAAATVLDAHAAGIAAGLRFPIVATTVAVHA
jgi:hypothetical protein